MAPDRYEILGEHGRGGLGTVSRAYDRELGRVVAIKELLRRGGDCEARFLREATITARLEHPGIVPVYEAGRRTDGTPFYVMKLVSGWSLRDLIARRPTVGQRMELLGNIIAVADAVAYAHERAIIHRDLKPGNVIVGDLGETVVIDWGLAKDLSEAGAGADAAPGSVVGTPSYMPPEQWRGERVDQRADVFAIGAMLWEVCSVYRVPPLDTARRDGILRRAHVAPDLIAIISKALAEDAAQRYRDAGELAADLHAFAAGARIASRRYSIFALLEHWIRTHRSLAIACVAAAVLVAGSLAVSRGLTLERDRAEVHQRRAEALSEELLISLDPDAVAVSADGARLAMLDAQRELKVWDLPSLEVLLVEPIAGALDVKFADRDTLIVREPWALRSVSVADSLARTRFEGTRNLTFDVLRGAVVVGDTRGVVTLLTTSLAPVAELAVCPTRVERVRLLDDRERFVYACAHGAQGIARYDIGRTALAVVDAAPR